MLSYGGVLVDRRRTGYSMPLKTPSAQVKSQWTRDTQYREQDACAEQMPTLRRCLHFADACAEQMPTLYRCLHFADACAEQMPTLLEEQVIIGLGDYNELTDDKPRALHLRASFFQKGG